MLLATAEGARALGRLDAAHCERGLSGCGPLGRPEARGYFTANTYSINALTHKERFTPRKERGQEK